VILDKNPLKVPPTSINEIVVVETIKEGKTLYQLSAKPDSSAKPQP
jgi:predicted amidohydrolase YtcJ